MTLASEIVDRVRQQGGGFELTSTGFKVRSARGSIPPGLISDLRRYKPQVRELLAAKRNYQSVYPPDQRQEELEELVRRIEREGYVLVWSNLLEDLLAFHRDDVSPAIIPADFVLYTDRELRHLFGEGKPEPSDETLRLIHQAKKTGAQVRDSRQLPNDESS